MRKLGPHFTCDLIVLAPLSRILHFHGDGHILGLLVYSHTFIFALEFSLKGKTANKKADFIYNSKQAHIMDTLGLVSKLLCLALMPVYCAVGK